MVGLLVTALDKGILYVVYGILLHLPFASSQPRSSIYDIPPNKTHLSAFTSL